MFEAGNTAESTGGYFSVPIKILPTWHLNLTLVLAGTAHLMGESACMFHQPNSFHQRPCEDERYLLLIVLSKEVPMPSAPGPKIAALDDPRHQGYHCYQRHTPKVRSNQSACWETCLRCGLRLSYTPKKDHQGERRHMGPDPRLGRHAETGDAGRSGDGEVHGTWWMP